MDKNARFFVARRRNELKRNGSNFIADISKATGVSPSVFTLLEPQYSVELENKINDLTRKGLVSGFVRRMCHMDIEEVINQLCEVSFSKFDDDVDVLFGQYEDFSVRCNLDTVLKMVPCLIDFDQDTITIVHREGQNGLMIDVETEAIGSKKFELDIWGEWHFDG